MFQMRILIKMIFGIYLLIVSGKDIRTRTIPLWWISSGLGIILFVRILFERQKLFLDIDWWCGIVCGIFFLGISLLSREKLGFADSIAIMGIFISDGYELGVVKIIISFLTAGAVILVLLIRKYACRETAIPFLPFLFIGYVGGELLRL